MAEKDSRSSLHAPDSNVQSKSRWPSFVPLWISTNLSSLKSWKMLVRCWLAAWVSFLLILIHPSLLVLGNAGFFALMGCLILPPSFPVQVFILAVGTMVGGMLFGWAILSAATRAAVAARNVVLLQDNLQRVQASIAGSSNPDALFRLSIFQGEFLDARSTAVFGCFFAVTIFILGLARAYSPPLLFFSVFGTIIVDVIACYGPLFPFAYYDLTNSMFISIGCYIAISLFLIIFMFPETMSHAYLELVASILANSKTAIDIQQEVLEAAPKDIQPGSSLSGRVAALRAGLVAQYTQLTLKTRFLDTEFTWGRWNGDDAKSLEKPLLGLVSRISGMQAFGQILGHPNNTPKDVSDSDSTFTNERGAWGDTYLLQQIYGKRAVSEKENSVGLEDIMPILTEATKDLREASSEGLAVVADSIIWANSRRYGRCTSKDLDDQHAKLNEAVRKLETALQEFESTKRHALFQPFEAMLASAKTYKEERSLPTRTLAIANVFVANLLVFVEVLSAFMNAVEMILAKRQNSRLWAPKGIRAIWKILTAKDHGGEEALGEDLMTTEADVAQNAFRRDPDSRPATNSLQKFASSFHAARKWTTTTEAVFAFKYTLVSVALWLPSVFKSSAYFCYVQKALWALVMAQTTLNMYAADQIFDYVTRISGTFVGAVYGLLAWYIGSGIGTGNPYGVAASTGVFLLPVVFVRLFIPVRWLTAGLLGGVTFALVVGYSYIDGHLLQISNPGVGWSVGWKRFVLILIGSAASFIVMMVPPKSGRKIVRLQNASTISAAASLYAFVMEAWIADTDISGNQHSQSAEALAFGSSSFTQNFREQVLSLGAQLQNLRGRTSIARWEGNLRGKWPFEQYNQLVDIQYKMLTSLGQLGSALQHLDKDWRLSFLHETKVVNPSFITDVMSTFALVSASLRNGEPLHEVLHTSLLDRLWYHDSVTHNTAPNEERNQPRSLENMRVIDYTYYTAALVAVIQVIESLQELQEITRDLCGQVPFRGFANWREDYDRAHNVL